MVDVAEDLIEATERDEKKHDIIDGVCIRHEKSVPAKFLCPFSPKNDAEQKERFLRPKRILGIVIKRFKTIDNFVEASYGPMISIEKATEKVMAYIKTASFPTPLEVIWCDDLIGSALMLRSYNDGTQAWYMKRKEFELTASNSSELMTIEEGLACLHTAFHGRYPYLGIPALLYYGACMADTSKAKSSCGNIACELNAVCRVKMTVEAMGRIRGAIAILRNQNNIDFAQLMCGKLAISDLPRIKDVCSAERIHLPYFMEPMAAYRTRLLQIARINGVAVMEVNTAPSSLWFDKTSKTSHIDSASRSFQDSKNTRPVVCSSAFYISLSII
eukprot:TsM_000706000 transcript=TsM_000706000 gene=TsM_000706000